MPPSTGYEVACLCGGDDYYTDRYWRPGHRLHCIPDILASAVWIRTLNADKGENRVDHLKLQLEAPASVYVAYDSRIVSLGKAPDWLTEKFELLNICVDIDEPDVLQEFALYRQVVVPGQVILGGNSAPGKIGDGDGSNYVVAIVFNEEPAAERDVDADGVLDSIDNCINTANPGQSDCDADGRGDACDFDYSNDARVDFQDLSIFATELAKANRGNEFLSCVDSNSDGMLAEDDLQPLMDAIAADAGY